MIPMRSGATIAGLVIGAAVCLRHSPEAALACWLAACITFGCAPRVR